MIRRILLQAALSLALCAALSALAFVCGITPDGILDGQWPTIDEHPTNWMDTQLHPWL